MPVCERRTLPSACSRLDDAPDDVHRDREAEAVRHLDAQRVDPDDAPLGVHERPAGVAGVDRGVGLDPVVVEVLLLVGEVAARVRHDPERDRPLEAVGGAERHHELALLQGRGRPELGEGDLLALGEQELQEREVGRAVEPHERGVHGPAVVQHAVDLLRLLGDVVVRDHVAVGRDDHAAPEDLDAAGLPPGEVLLDGADEDEGGEDAGLRVLDDLLEVEARLAVRARGAAGRDGGEHEGEREADGERGPQGAVLRWRGSVGREPIHVLDRSEAGGDVPSSRDEPTAGRPSDRPTGADPCRGGPSISSR